MVMLALPYLLPLVLLTRFLHFAGCFSPPEFFCRSSVKELKGMLLRLTHLAKSCASETTFVSILLVTLLSDRENDM